MADDDWPKTMRVVVHLRQGGYIEGIPSEVTADDFANLKEALTEVTASSDGWQVNLETAEGWAVFPGSSVNYVMVETDG